MFSSTLIALVALAASGFVSGHGIVKSVTVNGKTWKGALGPGSDAANSPVRAVASGDPIDDVTSPDMLCGTSSKLAPISAAVNAGDKVEVAWQAETGINWFHNVGPVQTYMTECNGDCKSFTPTSSTKWFKISALGQKGDSWYQADMNSGAPITVTIPSGLSNGNYLFRQEILALQNGNTLGKAEFYPNCIQMTISGGASGSTSPTPTTTFPGAYSATDPGIKVDVYTPPLNYVMPGPAIANIAKASSGGDNSQSSSAPAAASSAPANAAPSPSDPAASAPSSAPAATPTSSGSQCKRRKAKRDSATKQKNSLRVHAKRRIAEASY